MNGEGTVTKSTVLQVGDLELDIQGYSLLTKEGQIRLEPRSWDLLVYLVSRPGQMITKQELVDEVWSGAIVSDAAVSQAVLRLRAAMGDSSKSPSYIETIPRKGYCLVAPVRAKSSGRSLERVVGEPSSFEGDKDAEQTSHLVGRQAELNQLLSLWADVESGRGKIVFVQGEAGVGKTALVEEFARRVFATRETESFTYCKTFCAEDVGLNEAYLPIFELFGQLDSDCSEIQEIARACAPTWFSQAPLRTKFGLGTAEPGAKGLQGEAVQLVQQLGQLKPCLLVVEDVQWCDRSSLEFIGSLTELLSNDRVMIILTHRRGLDAVGVMEARLNAIRAKSRSQQITLTALREAEVREVIEQYLSVKDPNFEKLARVVWESTSGDPLYVKSLVEFVLEHVSLDELTDVAGYHEFEKLPLPKTISDAIAIKIEALPPDLLRVATAASVLGTRFTMSDLLELSNFHKRESYAALDDAVDSLAQKGLFRVFSGAQGRNQDVEFAHALERQVVYEAAALSDRRELHRQVGNALEESMSNELDLVAVKLGYHFAQGCMLSKAIHYLEKAARQMIVRGADQQAARFYSKIIELVAYLPHDDDEQESRKNLLELRAIVGLSSALLQSPGSLDLTSAAARVGELADRNWSDPQLFDLLASFFRTLFMNARADLAEPIIKMISDIAGGSREPIRQIQERYLTACYFHLRGELRDSYCALLQAREVFEEISSEGSKSLGPLALGLDQLGAWNALFQGENEAVVRNLVSNALISAQALSNPASVFTNIHTRLSMAVLLGNGLQVEDDIRNLVKQCAERRQSSLLRATEFLLFWVKVQKGETFSQQELARMWRGYSRAAQASKHPTSTLAFIEGCINNRSFVYALSLVDQQLRANEHIGCERDVAELLRLKAVALSCQGYEYEALGLLKQAVATAERQGNKLWQTRAARSLAMLEDQIDRGAIIGTQNSAAHFASSVLSERASA